MKETVKLWSLSVAAGALMLAAPAAHADPDTPAPPPSPAAERSVSTQAAEVAPADQPPSQPAEVPHLSSPQNLPPGTTNVPLDPGQGRTTSYLRDLWHAVQTQEISGKDAILLLTQRPLDPKAMPTNRLPAGPQAPPGTPLPQEPAPEAAPPVDAAPPTP